MKERTKRIECPVEVDVCDLTGTMARLVVLGWTVKAAADLMGIRLLKRGKEMVEERAASMRRQAACV